jgi:HEAT repeat protein
MNEKFIADLIISANHPDPDVRMNLAVALQFMTLGNVELLRSLAKDSAPQVRDAADTALATITAHLEANGNG